MSKKNKSFKRSTHEVKEESVYKPVHTSPKRQVVQGSKILKPKTINQHKYLKSFDENTITIGVGSAGTGKTILATFYAIQQILYKRYDKLIITRPIIEAGEKLGFLPGELEDKVDPFMRPIVDAIHDIVGSTFKNWMSNHVEIAPLAYLRGRTFNKCIMILDEAQNTTQEQMLMFLTRIGFESKAIITADPTQIDLPKRCCSGIIEALDFLYNKDNINVVYFNEEDIIRSEIVKTIVMAYSSGRVEKEKELSSV